MTYRYSTESGGGSIGYGDKPNIEHFMIRASTICLSYQSNGSLILREDAKIIRSFCNWGEIRHDNKTGYGSYDDDVDYVRDAKTRLRYHLTMALYDANLIEDEVVVSWLTGIKQKLEIR